jgi:hypothetical protein
MKVTDWSTFAAKPTSRTSGPIQASTGSNHNRSKYKT